MDLEIRRATEADLPGILRLYGQPGMNDGRVLTVEAAARILRRMATYPEYAVFVCLNGGSLVGSFALLVMDNLAHLGAPSAIVEDVCVDQGQRRSGVGRAMMKFAMHAATERGCYKLTLSSNLARTAAHTFYAALGFEQHGVSFLVSLGDGPVVAVDPTVADERAPRVDSEPSD
jgi:GNAT superfamily N-acetyltransferase